MKRISSYHYTKFIFFIRYLADALFYVYPALYLASIGVSEGLTGTILSLTTITGLVLNPIWSVVVKNNKVSRILLFVLSIIEGILIITYGNITSVPTIMALTCLLAVVACPYYNLLDGYAAQLCDKYCKEYSRIRVMGSTAYFVALILSGVLLDFLGFKTLFLISGSIFILTGLLTVFLERFEINLDSNEEEKKRDYKAIIKNKWFILFSIAFTFTGYLTMTSDSFISLVFTKVKGLTGGQYSLIHSGAILAEIITIYALGRLKRNVNLNKLFIIAGLILFLRPFILSFTELPTVILMIGTWIRGIGWGMMLFVALKIIMSLVGLENTTTACIILAIFQSLFQFIMSNVIGYTIEFVGYRWAFLGISAIILVTILTYTLILVKNKRFNLQVSNEITIKE